MNKITARTFARGGLLGNPSDGYHGKTISVIIGNYYAEVCFEEANKISIRPAREERQTHDSIAALHRAIQDEGYYGAERLVKAALKRFVDFAEDRIDPMAPNFSVSVHSTIPRQVGLAGSSAIVMATLRAAMKWFQVEIEPAVLASLTLSAEKDELKIPAGLQDRVIQAFEGMVYMDFGQHSMSGTAGMEIGHYLPLDFRGLDRLYVAFSTHGSEPTEITHTDLRSKFQAGDPATVAAMSQFARLAECGKTAIENQNWTELHQLIDANFDLRRSICNLHPHHCQMIDTSRKVGASAKFCGSGGAIIGTCSDDAMFQDLSHELGKIGCVSFRPMLGHFQ